MKAKLKTVIQNLERKYGKVKLPDFLPPPQSADMEESRRVAEYNANVVAGAVLGLHGPPQEGHVLAASLMDIFVDWNEVRVADPEPLVRVCSVYPQAQERVRLLQRFLEAFFLRQRNVNLDMLAGMKPPERKNFISGLEIFNREELAALLLTCFGNNQFPPAEELQPAAVELGLITDKTTVLQMARELQKGLDIPAMITLLAHLYAVAREPKGKPRARKTAANKKVTAKTGSSA
jgi:hypothetical protein